MAKWRSIPGYSSYEVSSDGRVRRAVSDSRGRFPAGYELRLSTSPRGYRLVTLFADDGGRRARNVHGLVAEAFLGARPSDKDCVAHWDGNPANNTVANLRWATDRENWADRYRHGRDHIGGSNPKAKLDEAKVADILRRVGEGDRPRRIAEEYGVTDQAVYDIAHGRNWRHVPRPQALIAETSLRGGPEQ